MKRIILLLGTLLCTLILQAQGGLDYRPFIEEGKVWKVGRYPFGAESPQMIKEFYFDGDTTISGNKCKRWMCRQEGTVKYVGALFEADRQVWLFLPGRSEAGLLYDFGAKANDMVKVTDFTASTSEPTVSDCTVSHVFSVIVHNRTLRCSRISTEPEENYSLTWNVWMEGIGTKCAPLLNLCDYVGLTDRLMTCSVNGDVIYEEEDNPVGVVHSIIADYHPFIEDGKRWLTGNFPYDGDPRYQAFSFSSYSVEGDTIVHEQPCKRLVKRTWQPESSEDKADINYVIPVFEENRQIWFFPAGQEEARLMYDFRPTEDTITIFSPTGDSARYKLTGIKDGNDEDGRRSYFFKPLETEENDSHETYSDEVNYWLESIGSAIAPDFIARMDLAGNSQALLKCTVNERLLYMNSIWDNKTAVNSPDTAPVFTPCYDLSGRRLTAPPAKGMYIENGRKRVVK